MRQVSRTAQAARMSKDDNDRAEAESRPAGRALGRRSWPDSFRHAWHGLTHVFKTQRNLRVHLVACVLVYAVAAVLGVSAVELAILTLAMALVVVCEVLNTVLEVAVDLFIDGYHPLAKIAKDVAAGAVLTAAFFAVLVGILVFVPHLASFVSSP
jgi:undecaprenol kinase